MTAPMTRSATDARVCSVCGLMTQQTGPFCNRQKVPGLGMLCGGALEPLPSELAMCEHEELARVDDHRLACPCGLVRFEEREWTGAEHDDEVGALCCLLVGPWALGGRLASTWPEVDDIPMREQLVAEEMGLAEGEERWTEEEHEKAFTRAYCAARFAVTLPEMIGGDEYWGVDYRTLACLREAILSALWGDEPGEEPNE